MYDIKKVFEDLKSTRKKKVVLDTDTFNEIDDQFALAYLLQATDAVELLGITAAPFHNWRSDSFADGMEKSYQEILNILSLTRPDFEVPVFRGTTEHVSKEFRPVESPAADFIVKQALACEGEPLYILAIGALSNVASAILKEPKIQDKIAVVWLGCNQIGFPSGNAGEFNLDQDFYAARVVYQSDVALVSYPASDVTSAMWIPAARMEKELAENVNPYSRYMLDFWNSLKGDREIPGRIIWDIAGTGCFTVPEAAEQEIMKKPLLKDDMAYDFDNAKYEMIYTSKIHANLIVDDLFEKIKTIKK